MSACVVDVDSHDVTGGVTATWHRVHARSDFVDDRCAKCVYTPEATMYHCNSRMETIAPRVSFRRM